MNGLYKFIFITTIFILYFLYVCWKYGIENGISVTLLTWSFFIFGTPVSDADAIIEFPIRVIYDIPMEITEIYLFILAIFISLWHYFYKRYIFKYTIFTRLIYNMITNPISLYGLIVVLSLIGSLISSFFENSIYNFIIYKKVDVSIHYIIFGVFLFSIVWIIYLWILYKLNIFNEIFTNS